MKAINTNLYAMNAQRGATRAQDDLDRSLQRLSSGLRINSARDDAAGLAIADRLGATVRGLERAAKNTNDGISLLQVADGAVATIVNNFQRIRELAVQAANGSNSRDDRQALQAEVNALVNTNFQIADQSAFNHRVLLDGSFSDQLQVGANAGDTINLIIPSLFAQRSGVLGLVDVPLRQVSVTAQVTGALGAGDLTIDGSAVGAALAGGAVGQGTSSAFAIAAAINNAAIAGASATASTTVSGNVANGGNIGNGGLSVNGVALGAISGANAAAFAISAAAAFSGAAGTSGVTASASGGVLTLTAADGRDIAITQAGAGNAAALGLATGTTRGSITLSGQPAVAVHMQVGGANPGAAGLVAGPQASVLTGATVSLLQPLGAAGEPQIDLSSYQGASDALTYVDTKIDGANALRAFLGATQNRLEHIYTGLQDGAVNQAAARSRIRDTDFAQETAQLTRAQILQRAATAVLTQANALPNTALLLLR